MKNLRKVVVVLSFMFIAFLAAVLVQNGQQVKAADDMSTELYIGCGDLEFYSRDGSGQTGTSSSSCFLGLVDLSDDDTDYIYIYYVQHESEEKTYTAYTDKIFNYGTLDQAGVYYIGFCTKNHYTFFSVQITIGSGSSSGGSSGGSSSGTDTDAPVLTIGTPSGGSISESGAATVYNAGPGVSVLVDFEDETSLYEYSNTSYYRYGWSESNSDSPTWVSISGTRNSTNVYGYVTTPSTTGIWYLWIEGDVRDNAGNYMDNDTNIGGITSSSSSHRIFEFEILSSSSGGYTGSSDAPVLYIGTPTGGYISGSGTSTVYYGSVGGTVLVDFEDESYLEYYSSTSYYRYAWSDNTSSHDGYVAIDGTRTSTNVYEYIDLPSTAGTYYLWIEGDVKDEDGNYMENGTNIDGLGPSDTSARIFKFIISGSSGDTEAPTLTIGTPTGGYVYENGTASVYYSKPSVNVTITFEDNVSLYNYSHTSYYRYAWSTSSSTTPTWVSISGTRTSSLVSGTVSTPAVSATTVYYLWIEGDVKDNSDNYMENDTNINGYGSSTSSARKFKFVIDTVAPTATFNGQTITNGQTIKTMTAPAIAFSDNYNVFNIKEGSTTRLSSGLATTYNYTFANAGTQISVVYKDAAGNSGNFYINYAPIANIQGFAKDSGGSSSETNATFDWTVYSEEIVDILLENYTTIVWFFGDYGTHGAEASDEAFNKYGITEVLSTSISNELISAPKGQAGDIVFYFKIVGAEDSFKASNTQTAVGDGTVTTAAAVAFEEMVNNHKVVLSSSILENNDTHNSYSIYLLLAMLVVSIILAIEIIAIRKNKTIKAK